MSHLEIIKEAYDKCGITYVIRENKDGNDTWSYLFLYGTENKKRELENENIDYLTMGSARFIEFLDGMIASY